MHNADKNRDRSFGKYTLVTKLATGGMGEIFLAHFSGLGGFRKVVVIKRLLSHLAEDENFVAMFLDEARIAAQLTHPNVCQVYDLGQVDGQYFIAMEYLEGVTFSRMVRNAGKDLLDVGLVTALIQQACEGLHHAHELRNTKGELINVVHRDVSPSNLFVTSNGILKVLDFGIAKAQGAMAQTRTGTLKGKYAYMSPEQLLGQELDRRSDIFALGVVLFEALTGRRLFHRESDFLIFRAITEDRVPSVEEYRDGVPKTLSNIVAQALSRDPDERFQTIREFGEALAHETIRPHTTVGISDFIEEHYHDKLEERRQLVENAELSGDITRTSGTIEAGGSVGIEALRQQAHYESPHPNAFVPGQQSSPQLARRKHTLLFVTVALVLAVGLSIGATWLLGEENSPDVIIVDKRNPRNPPVTPIQVAQDAGINTQDAGTNTKPTNARINEGPKPPIRKKNAGPKPPPRDRKPNYSATVRRKSGRIKKCFTKYAVNITGTPTIKLVLNIAASGNVKSVAIQPSSFQGSTLGSCIRSIARKIKFAPSKTAVKVRVPLSIRIK